MKEATLEVPGQRRQNDFEVEIIDRRTYRRNKVIRFILLSAASLLTILTVIGTAGLAFFFVVQFGHDFNLALSFTIQASFFVSSLIFSAYFSIFTLGIWKKTTDACDESFPLKNQLKFRANREHENLSELADKDSAEQKIRRNRSRNHIEKTTKKQKIAQAITGIFGIIAVTFLAGGAYLGVMTVGSAVSMLSLFFPLAITSAVCMFSSMTYYFWDDMMTNARKLFAPKSEKMAQRAREKEAQPDLDVSKFSPSAKRTVNIYRVMAVGACIGFAAFKVYSSVHLAIMLGITSPAIIAVTGGVAFLSMTIMTAMTSGVRIWNSGIEYAAKKDGKKIPNHLQPENTIERTNLIRYAAAWTITFFASAFNAVASYMGMATLSGFFCSLFPSALFVLTPAFVALGAFVALCRFIDFWEYYGPRIAVNLGGTEYVPNLEAIEHKEAEQALIKKHSAQFGQFHHAQYTRELAATLLHAKGYSNPYGGSVMHLRRGQSLAQSKLHPVEHDLAPVISDQPQTIFAN